MNPIRILPFQASNFATELDWLFFALVALTVFFTTFVFALVIILAVRYRKDKKDRYDPVQNEHMWLELTWTIIPMLIGLGLFFWGADLFMRMYSEPPKGALDIFVTGKQWMWKFQYPDGKRQVNYLYVPEGQPVKLTMVSEDVIHSFFIPDFRVKHDVVPMRYTSLWFIATRPGIYPISCSQYCGSKHSEMIGKVHVLSQKDYAEWLSGGGNYTVGKVTTASAGTTGGDAAAILATGAEIYTRMACATCHNNPQIAPTNLGIYGTKVTLTTGQVVAVDENYLRESVLRPNAKVVKGFQPVMPSFQGLLSEEELMALIQYLKSSGKKK